MFLWQVVRAVWRSAGMVLCCLLVLSCNRDAEDRELELLGGARLSGEALRLRKAQMVRVVDHSTSPPTVRLMSHEIFRDVVVQYCAVQLGVCNDRRDGCGNCETATELCAAHTYLDLSGVRSNPLELHGLGLLKTVKLDSNGDPIYTVGSGGRLTPVTELVSSEGWEIGPQATATNSHLAELAGTSAIGALYEAALGMSTALAIDYPAEVDAPPDCSEATESEFLGVSAVERTVAQSLAASYAEAYELLWEASERWTEHTVAAADAALSNPSIQAGREAAYDGAELSRVSAARRLTGQSGAGTPLSIARELLCEQPPPAGATAVALEVLRSAGHSIGLLGDADIDIDALVDGPLPETEHSSPAELSARLRVAEIWERPELALPGKSLFEELGLSREAFAEARAVLVKEHGVFARSSDRKAAPPPGRASLTFERYAGTVSPPSSVPDSYYFGKIHQAYSLEEISPNGPTPFLSAREYQIEGTWSFAEQAGLALYYANALLEGGAEDLGLADVLATVALRGETERTARIQTCHYFNKNGSSNSGNLRITAWGFSKTDGVVVLKGEDALRCATTGAVDGEPCSSEELGILAWLGGRVPQLGDWTVAALNLGPGDLPIGRNFEPNTTQGGVLTPDFQDVAWNAIDGSAIAVGEEYPSDLLYFVKLKPNAVLGEPGSYEEVGALRPSLSDHAPDFMAESCVTREVFPSMVKLVAEIMAPDPRACHKPSVECDGTRFDERIPLEDELSEDFDGVESSWRHYLALARQAASESDLLGQTYINEAIDLDARDAERLEAKIQRAEGAIDELKQICGSSADARTLLKLLTGSDRSLSGKLVGEPCSADDSCPATKSCIGGRCIADPRSTLEAHKSDPEVARILECIGEGGARDFAALGSDPVCIWHREGNPNYVCEDPEGKGGQCPAPCALVDELEGVGRTWLPPETNGLRFVRFEVEDTPERKRLLGYFETPSEVELEATCSHLQALRDQPDPELLNAQVSSGAFLPEVVLPRGSLFGWEARMGGYSAITYDGAVLYETGDTISGPAKGWPCGAGPEVWDCPDDSKGFFCMVDPSECQDPFERARTNQRMLEAVLAVRAITTVDGKGSKVGGLQGIKLPYLLSHGSFDRPNAPWNEGQSYLEVGFAQAHDTGAWVDGKWQSTGLAEDEEKYVKAHRGYWEDGNDILQAVPYGFYYHWLNDPTLPVWYQVQSDDVVVAYPSAGVAVEGEDREAPGEQAYRDVFRVNLLFGIGEVGSVGWSAIGTYNRWDPYQAWAGMSPDSRYALNDGKVHPLLWGELYRGFSGDGVPFVIPPRLRILPEVEARYDAGLLGGLGQRMVDCLDGSCAPDGVSSVAVLLKPRGGVRHIVPQYDLNQASLLDAAELICGREARVASGCGATVPPPKIRTAAELVKAENFLRCKGGEIERRASLAVFPSVPPAAIDALRRESLVGSFPALGGHLGEAVGALRAALVGASEVAPQIADNLSGMANDIKQVRLGLRSEEISKQINETQFLSTVSAQIAACASASAGAISSDPSRVLGGSLAAAATCLNTAAQIGYGRKLANLDNEKADVRKAQLVNDFVAGFESRAIAMRSLATEVTRVQQDIDDALNRIDTLYKQAETALSRALTLDSQELAEQYQVGRAMRARLNTSRVRYEESRRAAVRMAFMAKRAIEARLGLSLSRLTDDLPLVEAPALWESTVCETSGVDYAALKKEQAGLAPNESNANYASAFVGDYVSKLERVIESYRLAYNFNDGTDTAIVSLRDDIWNVRSQCDVPVPNLLFQAAQLDERPEETVSAATGAPVVMTDAGAPIELAIEETSGWAPEGCPELTSSNIENSGSCVSVQALPAAPENVAIPDLSSGGTTGYRVTFGTILDTGPCETTDCGVVPGSALVQRKLLQPGLYRLSWYARPPADLTDDPNTSAVDALDAEGVPYPRLDNDVAVHCVEEQWHRYWFIFEVEDAETVRIAIQPIPGATTAHARDIAALMLEDVSRLAPDVSLEDEPKEFVNTHDTLVQSLEVCEDTDGVAFRNQGWRYKCAKLCADSFASDCVGAAASKYCYWETSFHISQHDTEANNTFVASGFARGNFNYRVESVGLNFVGSNTRDCESSDTPSACYAGAFIPYTLTHHGPYTVRNHFGEDYDVPLFTGRIEHARGLAAERYLTNPLSGADSELMSGYVRSEFQGRPLAGTFALKVWDEPGVNFGAIQDVQVLLNYRYWTRSQ